jgi:hypothetical protein
MALIAERKLKMRFRRWILTALFVTFIASPVRGAGSHNHSHGDHATEGLSLDHGKKWPTDSSLRKGMTEIRAAMEAKADASHVSTLPAASYAQLGEKVSRSLSFIFKNCKLKPEADAMLHILLVRIQSGASKMKEETKPAEQVEGASAVAAALTEYPVFFNHPGWRPLKKK